MRFDGQQRVMRQSGAPLGSPAERQVLTNRMRENFTYGSVGGAEGNLGSYPALDARTAFCYTSGVVGPARVIAGVGSPQDQGAGVRR